MDTTLAFTVIIIVMIFAITFAILIMFFRFGLV